jgi:hypothetical protein
LVDPEKMLAASQTGLVEAASEIVQKMYQARIKVVGQ